MDAKDIIDFFGMRPLACEGGYYVETYRSAEKISQAGLGERYSGDRNYSTAIVYLITAEKFSAMHRVKSDELFHFYFGDPVTMLQLHPQGDSEVITLGHDILEGQHVQAAVRRDSWQGCCLCEGGKFALLGCTVAPGFEFEDFELADRNELLERYPGQRELILKLARKDRPLA